MKIVHMVTFLLVVIGGINWGLVGIADIDLVDMFLGSMAPLDRVVYVLVGVSAVVELLMHKKNCVACTAKSTTNEGVTPTA